MHHFFKMLAIASIALLAPHLHAQQTSSSPLSINLQNLDESSFLDIFNFSDIVDFNDISYYASLFGTIGYANDIDIEKNTLNYPSGSVEPENPIGIGAAIGIVTGSIRSEFEISYQGTGFEQEISNTEYDIVFNVTSFMANTYFDIPINDKIDFYLGGGAGLAIYRADIEVENSSRYVNNSNDTIFAYQFMAGITYSIDPNYDIILGYRYYSSLDPSFSELEISAPVLHTAMIGFKYNF